MFENAGLYESQNAVLHLIRHTVATRLVTSGVDLETARDVLGHADVSTTALYLRARINARRQLRRSWRSELSPGVRAVVGPESDDRPVRALVQRAIVDEVLVNSPERKY